MFSKIIYIFLIKYILEMKLILEKALAYTTYWIIVYPPLLTRASASKYLWQSVLLLTVTESGMGDI